MMHRSSFISFSATILFGAGLAPAWAHHSFAMFDQTKTLALQGSVSKFEWANPHVFVFVDVPTKGRTVTYALESSSPSLMRHAGWKFDTLKPGDRVDITLHPFKDGKPGGMLVTVKLPSGETLKGW